MQHIDRTWCYLEEILDRLREKLTIREAQQMLAGSEKPHKYKSNWYLSIDNEGHKEQIKVNYLDYGVYQC